MPHVLRERKPVIRWWVELEISHSVSEGVCAVHVAFTSGCVEDEMTSDTPRTDEAVKLTVYFEDYERYAEILGLANQLERELNEANLKIQKMDAELKQLRSRDEFFKKYTITTV